MKRKMFQKNDEYFYSLQVHNIIDFFENIQIYEFF